MPTIYAISKPQHKIFIETALALTKGGRDYWANSPESVVMRDHWDVSMGGCLVFWKLSLITPHSIFFTHHLSLITHHLSLKLPQFPKPHPFGTYFQLLITQCFLLFVGPIPEHLVKYFLMFMLFSASYFFFFLFLIPFHWVFGLGFSSSSFYLLFLSSLFMIFSLLFFPSFSSF